MPLQNRPPEHPQDLTGHHHHGPVLLSPHTTSLKTSPFHACHPMLGEGLYPDPPTPDAPLFVPPSMPPWGGSTSLQRGAVCEPSPRCWRWLMGKEEEVGEKEEGGTLRPVAVIIRVAVYFLRLIAARSESGVQPEVIFPRYHLAQRGFDFFL